MRQASASDKRYGWKLEARPDSSSGGFSLVAAGTIQVGEQPRRGRGAFGVDCGALSAADASVACRGTLLMGFAHTNDGDKILEVRLGGYTPDASANMPLDATVFDWRLGDDSANHVRLVDADESLGHGHVGARDGRHQADLSRAVRRARRCRGDRRRHRAGTDVHRQHLRPAQPGSVTRGDVVRHVQQRRDRLHGYINHVPRSAADLRAANPDATASDPPAGMPEMPAAPTGMPDGSRR